MPPPEIKPATYRFVPQYNYAIACSPYTPLTELSLTTVETVYGAVRNTALNITSIHFRLKGQIPVNYRNLFKLYAARSWVDDVYLSREALPFVKP